MNPDFKILYVNDTIKSGQFYSDLLGKEAIEGSPTFTMIPLENNFMLGLWADEAIEPKSQVRGGGSELGFTLANNAEVDKLYASWCARGLSIAQVPTQMHFGYTFVALDPDGHRLRVMAPVQQ